jgi:hypothetical protein
MSRAKTRRSPGKAKSKNKPSLNHGDTEPTEEIINHQHVITSGARQSSVYRLATTDYRLITAKDANHPARPSAATKTCPLAKTQRAQRRPGRKRSQTLAILASLRET